MLALQMYRSLPKYVAARAVGSRLPGVLTGPAAPLRLATLDEPRVRRPGWARVRSRLSGICGSDLGAITGSTSLYFSALVSWPFVPGHEVVGELVEDCEDLPAGTRVVLDPVLNSEARGVGLLADAAPGTSNRSDHITVGAVSPGLQTGYCRDTGGGWGKVFAAHRSQLHPVPDDLPDERAVLIEPLACAVHTALRARVPEGGTVLVNGAGAVGLFTTLALREFSAAGTIVVVAKHARQRELATRFGASTVLGPEEVVGGVRRMTRALRLRPDRGPDYLLGGVDVAVDAVGSRDSIGTAMRVTRGGGRVVLSGMPSAPVDLSPAWFRELEVTGTYASARREPLPGGERDAFAAATDLAASAPLDDVLGATYPLHQWREALDHAHSAGRLGTVKVAFDVRSS